MYQLQDEVFESIALSIGSSISAETAVIIVSSMEIAANNWNADHTKKYGEETFTKLIKLVKEVPEELDEPFEPIITKKDAERFLFSVVSRMEQENMDRNAIDLVDALFWLATYEENVRNILERIKEKK